MLGRFWAYLSQARQKKGRAHPMLNKPDQHNHEKILAELGTRSQLIKSVDKAVLIDRLKKEFEPELGPKGWIWQIATTAFWLCVDTDEQMHRINASSEIKNRFNAVLDATAYPEGLRSEAKLQSMSQETINREYQGSWRYWFQ